MIKERIADADVSGLRPEGDNPFLTRQMWIIVLIALAVRLVTAYNTYVVNLDGCIYIHQARAFHFGMLDQLTACAGRYFSNYPILIAWAYHIFGDWVTAARSVSVLFGTLTMIPLYLLIRRFFDERLTGLIALTFAVMPTLVVRSADVVRGPVYWFFLATGIYLFITGLERGRRRCLALAGLSLILAAWGRIEGAVFIPASLVYLAVSDTDRKLRSALAFLTPVIVVAGVSILGMLFYDESVNDVFRIKEALIRLRVPLWQYERMRGIMAYLAAHPQDPTMGQFLDKARNMIWLIAIGTMLRFMAEAFYYPFFLTSLLGVFGLARRIKKDRRLSYFVLLAASSLLILYVLLIESWVMERRYLVLTILPSFIFYGFGLQRIIDFCRKRLKAKEAIVFGVLALAIMGLTVPKFLGPREADKLIFQEIGELIAGREGNDRVIKIISASPSAGRWASFYANLNYQGAPCPESEIDTLSNPPRNPETLREWLKSLGTEYFIWVERHWPEEAYDFLGEGLGPGWTPLGQFQHPDSGRIILFQAD